MISISLAVEDDLSEFVLRRVLSERSVQYNVRRVLKKGGFGYLKKQCRAFNNLAQSCPVLLLTDLDQSSCPTELIKDWISFQMHPRFLMRVAVREIEAWLLAHESALRKFLKVRGSAGFRNPELLPDPKASLLSLAASSPTRRLREALTRTNSDGNLRQGPAYNTTLAEFLNTLPCMTRTMKRCASFERMLRALDRLEVLEGYGS